MGSSAVCELNSPSCHPIVISGFIHVSVFPSDSLKPLCALGTQDRQTFCVRLPDGRVSLKSGFPYGTAAWYEDWPLPLLQVSQLPGKALLSQEELCSLFKELRSLW